MKTFLPLSWDMNQCRRELDTLRGLLAGARELKERDHLLPLFKRSLHLSAFLGSFHADILHYDLVAHEYDLFGDFTCDVAVGDSKRKVYGFIEFEDAVPRGMFVSKKGKASPEWSPRFDHGFSQIIDWFCKLDDMEKTDEFEGRFGKRSVEYFGMVVVGRSEPTGPKEQNRLAWRTNKVLVNSRKVTCVTFDQLCEELQLRLDRLSGLSRPRRRK